MPHISFFAGKFHFKWKFLSCVYSSVYSAILFPFIQRNYFRLFSETISVYSAKLFPFIQRHYFRLFAAFFAVLTQWSALTLYAVRSCTYVWETAYYETRDILNRYFPNKFRKRRNHVILTSDLENSAKHTQYGWFSHESDM